MYTETHTITTNDFGMVNLKLGGGTSNDDMMNIDWSGDSYFLAVGLDINGGSSYTAMGTSELVSVPYALMAYRSENDSVNDADADPANEIQTLSLLGDQLSLTSGGSVTFPYDSSYWQIDADTIYTMDEHVAIGANSPRPAAVRLSGLIASFSFKRIIDFFKSAKNELLIKL